MGSGLRAQKLSLREKYRKELCDAENKLRLNYARSYFLDFSIDQDVDFQELQEFYQKWREFDDRSFGTGYFPGFPIRYAEIIIATPDYYDIIDTAVDAAETADRLSTIADIIEDTHSPDYYIDITSPNTFPLPVPPPSIIQIVTVTIASVIATTTLTLIVLKPFSGTEFQLVSENDDVYSLIQIPFGAVPSSELFIVVLEGLPPGEYTLQMLLDVEPPEEASIEYCFLKFWPKLLNELKNEIDELPQEAFKRPRFAHWQKRWLSNQVDWVTKNVERGKYKWALWQLKSLKWQINWKIIEPWKSELIEMINTEIGILESLI